MNTDKYAVIGNPIAHSKSPMIHEAFAKQTAQNISYERVLAPLDGFTDTVDRLMGAGYKGVNVTVPFKFEAFKLCREKALSLRAHSANAVNTLKFSGSEIVIADNTDGHGLVTDIQKNKGISLHNKRVLLLGAGGAASGVVLPLLIEKCQLTIANRTLDKAIQLKNHMAQLAQSASLNNEKSIESALKIIAFSQLSEQSFDVIINATSAGLNDTTLPIPDTIFTPNCFAYDMMYGRETPFMTQARAAGAQVTDGLGMLVEQAAESFYLWRGVRPQTQAVIQLIRNL